MLTALKIGLLALLPLGMVQNDNAWCLSQKETSYHYQNSYEYLSTNSLLDDIEIIYNGLTYTFSITYPDGGYTQYSSSDTSSGVSIKWLFNPTAEQLEIVKPYTICLFQYSDIVPFEDSLIIKSKSSMTSTNIKALNDALEKDIELNKDMPSINDIFGQVTNSITSFVGSLGQAFNSVTSLFYNNGSFTFLGVLILIGVGVGLVYGAYRLIKGLLHRV